MKSIRFSSAVFFFLCSLLISESLFSQRMVVGAYNRVGVFLDDKRVDSDIIDTLKRRIFYSSESVLDTLENYIVEEIQLLEVGENICKYYSYDRFRYDSLLCNNFAGKLHNYSSEEWWNSWSRVFPRNRFSKCFFPISFFEVLYINLRDGDIVSTGRLVATDFVYEEKIPSIDWMICDSLSSWQGMLIRKAECFFRGRHYTAWFTPEIPLKLGPWKFSGLPGLIVRVSDDRGFYSFTLNKVETVPDSVFYPIERQKYHYIRTTRSKYLEARKNLTANYLLYNRYFNGGTGAYIEPPKGYTKKELGNDFIEKDLD